MHYHMHLQSIMFYLSDSVPLCAKPRPLSGNSGGNSRGRIVCGESNSPETALIHGRRASERQGSSS